MVSLIVVSGLHEFGMSPTWREYPRILSHFATFCQLPRGPARLNSVPHLQTSAIADVRCKGLVPQWTSSTKLLGQTSNHIKSLLVIWSWWKNPTSVRVSVLSRGTWRKKMKNDMYRLYRLTNSSHSWWSTARLDICPGRKRSRLRRTACTWKR